MSNKKWQCADILPEPGDLIIMRLDDGSEVEGVRPNYANNDGEQFKGYHDMKGNQLHNVKLWAIK